MKKKLFETTHRKTEDDYDADCLPCDVCLYFKRKVKLDVEAESEYRSHLDRQHGLIP